MIHLAAIPLPAALAGPGLRVPVDIDRDQARAAARRELADPAYRAAEPSWFERALAWVFEQLAELLGDVAATVPTGIGSLVILAVLVVIVAIIVRLRMGKAVGTGRRREGRVFSGRPRTAAEHRRAAEDALARDELGEAVRERFRAVVRELEQRGLLDERPGRTADEAAAEGAEQLPGCAAELGMAARIFDDVWYGGRPATREAYDEVAAADVEVQAQRPAVVRAAP